MYLVDNAMIERRSEHGATPFDKNVGHFSLSQLGQERIEAGFVGGAIADEDLSAEFLESLSIPRLDLIGHRDQQGVSRAVRTS